jgi:hypothetical protein
MAETASFCFFCHSNLFRISDFEFRIFVFGIFAMPINVACPRCAKPYALPENLAGKVVRCASPTCQAQFRVPGQAAVAAAPPVPPPSPPALPAQALTAPPPLPPPAKKKRFDPDATWEDSAAGQRRSVQIASDLDGSPRPKRAPIMVLAVLGAMALLTLLALGSTVGGGIVLAAKIQKLVPKDPKDVNDALRLAHSGNSAARLRAVKWLQKQPLEQQQRDAVAVMLARCVMDQDVGLRLEALKALDTWGGRSEVPVFLEALESDHAPTWQAASELLLKHKDESLAQELAKRIGRTDGKHVPELLEKMGPMAEKPLIEATHDRTLTPERRVEACRILGKVATEEGRRRLEEVTRDPDSPVADAARQALEQLQKKS